jgi:DNA adenine methylase
MLPYKERFVAGIWTGLERANKNPELADDLRTRNTSKELSRKVCMSGVATLTGRIRGRVRYSQARNTPFQGLAADGAALALFALAREGFRVVGFVHDEVLVELPDEGGFVSRAAIERIEQIMVREMEKVLGGLPAGVESALSTRWSKEAKHTILGERVLPWVPKKKAPPSPPVRGDELVGESGPFVGRLSNVHRSAEGSSGESSAEEKDFSLAPDKTDKVKFVEEFEPFVGRLSNVPRSSGGSSGESSSAALPPTLPPATADDQAHNSIVPVPPKPPPPVPPPTLPPAPIALPPTVFDRPRRKTTAAPRPGRQKVFSPPLKRHGGKSYLAARIVALMPPHVHYVEPFAGGAAVLLARNPNDPRFFLSDHRDHQGVSEVINDLDGRLTNFWRVLGDIGLFAQFQRRVEAIPLSRPEFEKALEHEYGNDPVADAVAFFVENRQSRQALGRDFVTHVKSRVRRGMNDHASAWLSAVLGLPAIHERLKRVVVENRPALDVIREHDSNGAFFYNDPPYLHETRTATDAYGNFEMTEADHRELLDVLLHCQGKVMLSGYANELYDKMLAGWRRYVFDPPNNAASGKEKRRMEEVIWCNFGSEGDGR